jgi:hypothetical protein
MKVSDIADSGLFRGAKQCKLFRIGGVCLRQVALELDCSVRMSGTLDLTVAVGGSCRPDGTKISVTGKDEFVSFDRHRNAWNFFLLISEVETQT